MENHTTKEQIVQILMSDQIVDPIDPMRSDMDRDALYDLADNIKQNGLINPITVRPIFWNEASNEPTGELYRNDEANNKSVRYEVVAGHRRFTACKIIGKIRIECVVRDLTDTEVFSIKAAENIERQEVDVVDEAIFMLDYMKATAKTPEEVAKQYNRSMAYVNSRLAIAEMPDYMQAGLKDGTLKLGVALTLNKITDERIKELWTQMAIRDGISVAQAEHWYHGWKLNTLPGGSNSETPPEDYTPGSPQVIKFKCSLTGIEEDARQFRTLLIHESKLDLFNTIAAEIQKADESDNTQEVGGEAPDTARA